MQDRVLMIAKKTVEKEHFFATGGFQKVLRTFVVIN